MMHVVIVPALARLVFLLVLLVTVTLYADAQLVILAKMELIVRQAKLHAQHALVTTTLAKQAQKIVFHVAKTRQVLLL